MKKLNRIALVALMSLSGMAFADDTVVTTTPAATPSVTTVVTTPATPVTTPTVTDVSAAVVETDGACKAVVTACKDAGYVKEGDEGKRFWMDCMKPIVMMGSPVTGVTVSDDDVKACRADKIAKMQSDLDQLMKMPH